MKVCARMPGRSGRPCLVAGLVPDLVQGSADLLAAAGGGGVKSLGVVALPDVGTHGDNAS